MNLESITQAFLRMGARFATGPFPPPPRIAARAPDRSSGYTLDVKTDRHGEHFLLLWDGSPNLQIQPLHVDRGRRHLLLFVRHRAQHLFLCGHDERHWFAAAVPGHGVTTVERALEALKPPLVRELQDQLKVQGKYRQRRKNRGFIRQGEWFFVPAPEADSLARGRPIRRNEPLLRGSKPHIMEESFRWGGEVVYVSPRHPNGITEAARQKLFRENPEAAALGWRILVRDPTVYCRGRVHHRDHATVELHGWHRVYANTETQAPGRAALLFLD